MWSSRASGQNASRCAELFLSQAWCLEHDPEKCEAVFRKDHAQTTT
jgi:hypothetical protein